MIRPRANGDSPVDKVGLSDIYLNQLHQRDALVGEIWQSFFDSLRSICKEGLIFDVSNRQKLDILTKAADRLLRDFSHNSPYRVSDFDQKISELGSQGCNLTDDNAINDLCTANGNLLGSTLRMPEDPNRSIYASFVYPMSFILEFLHVVRK